jgi:hypothetical protein
VSSDQALPGEIIPQIASGDPAVSLFGRIGKWLGHAADLASFHPPIPVAPPEAESLACT